MFGLFGKSSNDKIVKVVKRALSGTVQLGPTRVYEGKLSSAALIAELQAEGLWGRIARTGGPLGPGEYQYILSGEANFDALSRCCCAYCRSKVLCWPPVSLVPLRVGTHLSFAFCSYSLCKNMPTAAMVLQTA